jgi:uronate dehydrogenase
MKRILITGAAGRIGTVLRSGLRGHYPKIRLTDVKDLGKPEANEEIVKADIADLVEVERMMDGVEGVVHLAARVSQEGWDEMLPHSFVSTYNVFEAARRKGVRRVVYASSIHAHGYYRRTQMVGADLPPRPDGFYGVSKVFGEAVGRMYADKHGLEVVCLRIASFREKPATPRELGTWLRHRDAIKLVRAALDAPDVHFEILYGTSRNSQKQYYDPNRVRLGYHPEDNSDDYAAEILKKHNPMDEPELERLFHGAHYCPTGFTGDVKKIV